MMVARPIDHSATTSDPHRREIDKQLAHPPDQGRLIPPDPDELVVRKANPFTLDKLEVLKMYDKAMTRACTRAPRVIYAEGFAGPGYNVIRGDRVLGSALIALETRPLFTTCLLMEANKKCAASLKAVTAQYGRRAQVLRGDCNRYLVPVLRDAVGPWDPCLCVLDPEGFDLSYDTLAGIASIKTRNKIEQLILLPTHIGFLRVLNRSGWLAPSTVEKMTAMFGTDEWLEIYNDRIAEIISTDEATTRYVRLYGNGLEQLGYKTVLDREIRDQGHKGKLRYFLVFATDHPLGKKIMSHVFDAAVAARHRDSQLTLFRQERRKRLS